jgi:hypothetical protein
MPRLMIYSHKSTTLQEYAHSLPYQTYRGLTFYYQTVKNFTNQKWSTYQFWSYPIE